MLLLLCKSSQHNSLCAQLYDLLFFRDYVRSELDSGYEGPIYVEPLSMNRFTTALIGIALHESYGDIACSVYTQSHRQDDALDTIVVCSFFNNLSMLCLACVCVWKIGSVDFSTT